MDPNVPHTFVGPFGWTVEVRWDYHALLMFSLWMILVPAIIIVSRFGKPAPTLYGSSKDGPSPLWFAVHRFGLSVAILLSLGGAAIALTVNRGFSGSLHSYFGLATVTLGCLQVLAAWLRGTSGGKFGVRADPDDPSTWRGDHYDMTPRRKWFEAYHKTAGYLTLFMAIAAVTTGLSQYWFPTIAVTLGLLLVAALALFVLLEGTGRRQDTYLSVYGNHPDHPYNRSKASRLSEETPQRKALGPSQQKSATIEAEVLPSQVNGCNSPGAG
jgi:hypothetical protein